jgi:hypothetical protein
MDRRGFLKRTGFSVSIGVAVAGCSGSPVEDGESDGGGGTNRERIVNNREEVAEDEYIRFSFDLNREATLDYEFVVRNGPDIEIFIMDDAEFDEFQAGNRFQVYSDSGGASGSDIVTLQEDSYRLVVDNTSAGSIEPPTNFDDDVAEVEVDAWVEG